MDVRSSPGLRQRGTMRVKTVAGTAGPSKERTMTTRVQERVEVLRDERERAIRAATSVAVVGLLVGLSTFFVALAPHV
jgi:hypothetical protein